MDTIDLSNDMVTIGTAGIDPCSPLGMQQSSGITEINCGGSGSPWWPWVPIVITMLVIACVLCIYATHVWHQHKSP